MNTAELLTSHSATGQNAIKPTNIVLTTDQSINQSMNLPLLFVKLRGPNVKD